MSNRQRILVIDDDVQVVDTVETLLQSVGYETFHAFRTEDGMELARKNRPDLILLDVMFSGPPGPDGFETSRLVQDDPALKGIPIIMLSGVKTVMGLSYDFTPDTTWLPIKAFLEKPLRPDKLLREIEKVLGPREKVLA
jgi:twitching motility two-component system response regulator PilH